MKEFDLQCRCSGKENVKMEHVFGVEKIQKERMLLISKAKRILTGNFQIGGTNERSSSEHLKKL